MTMPDERLRALRFGREGLERIMADEALEQPIRKQAAWLFERYPLPEDIDRIDGLRYRGMRLQDVEVLDGCLQLFRELATEPGVDEELRREMRGTLRHYPTANEISTLRVMYERSRDDEGQYDAAGLVKILEARILNGDYVVADLAELSVLKNLLRRLAEESQGRAELQDALDRCVDATRARLG